MELKDLVGERMLSAVDYVTIAEAQGIAFTLDGVTYIAEEDPDDGYRSVMSEIRIYTASVRNRFNPVRVVCTHVTVKKEQYCSSDCDILTITDAASGRVIMEVGTDNTDDYYPCFVSSFRPENMTVPPSPDFSKAKRRIRLGSPEKESQACTPRSTKPTRRMKVGRE